MVNRKETILVFLLVWQVADLRGRKIDDDLVYQHEHVVRQRLAEVGSSLLPLPDDQLRQVVRHLGTLLAPVNADSELCRNHSWHLLNSFLENEIWALAMVDASSKIQSGVLGGHLHDLGNYQQCLSIEEPNQMFQGQLCAIETSGLLPPEISDKIKGVAVIDRDVMFSLCVPSSCSDHDVNTHVDLSLAALGAKSKSYLDDLALSTDIRQISCSSANRIPFRNKDYLAILVFASVVLLVLLGTFFGSKSVWLSYFSLSKNFLELLDTSASPEEISCLNGIRVLTILVTIFGHRIFQLIFFPTHRFFTMLQVFATVSHGICELFWPKTVETFFVIGGTVLSYSFFMKHSRGKGFSFADFCLSRYFRLTPVLAVVMLYHATLLVHTSHGPLWLRTMAEFEDSCYLHWWAGLLHISNVVAPHYACVSVSWYVANDFQLQCLAPILLLSILRRPRLGLTLVVLCSLVSLAAITFVAFYLQLSSGYWVGASFGDRLTDLHIPILYRLTIFRATPFLMGLVLGYVIFYCKQFKPPLSLSKLAVFIGWGLSISALIGLTVVTVELVSPDHEYMPLLDPLYVGFSRVIFSACVAWVIFACYFGYGGWINQFLSWQGFRPLARLVYPVYLVHYTVQAIQINSNQAPIILSYLDQTHLFLGDVLASFCIAALLHITVEIPVYKLANHILTDIQRGIHKKKKTK